MRDTLLCNDVSHWLGANLESALKLLQTCGHCWDYFPSNLLFLSSHCNSFSDKAPADEIYGCLMCKCTLVSSLNELISKRLNHYSGRTRSKPWLLMPWLLVSLGQQQPWYWLGCSLVPWCPWPPSQLASGARWWNPECSAGMSSRPHDLPSFDWLWNRTKMNNDICATLCDGLMQSLVSPVC